jgi:hypothetical protein
MASNPPHDESTDEDKIIIARTNDLSPSQHKQSSKKSKKSANDSGPPKPRRALNSYNIFFKLEAEKIREKNEKNPDRHAVTRTISELWKNGVDPQYKTELSVMAKADKYRYDLEMVEWKRAKKALGIQIGETIEGGNEPGNGDEGSEEGEEEEETNPNDDQGQDNSFIYPSNAQFVTYQGINPMANMAAYQHMLEVSSSALQQQQQMQYVLYPVPNLAYNMYQQQMQLYQNAHTNENSNYFKGGQEALMRCGGYDEESGSNSVKRDYTVKAAVRDIAKKRPAKNASAANDAHHEDLDAYIGEKMAAKPNQSKSPCESTMPEPKMTFNSGINQDETDCIGGINQEVTKVSQNSAAESLKKKQTSRKLLHCNKRVKLTRGYLVPVQIYLEDS